MKIVATFRFHILHLTSFNILPDMIMKGNNMNNVEEEQKIGHKFVISVHVPR